MHQRNTGGWPACPYDKRRPRPKVRHVTMPEYERTMRWLRRLQVSTLPRLELQVRICELNDKAESRP